MKKEKRKSKIGGQALIEGIMMRGLDRVAIAVRKPDGEIAQEEWKVSSLVHPTWYRRIPIVRGVVNFVESLILGYRCLMKSANIAVDEQGQEQEQQKSSWLDRTFGENIYKIAGFIGAVLGVILAVALFMYLPALTVKGINSLLSMDTFAKSLIEGVIKIGVFVLYLVIISRMKEIRRTFEYHGAEHKTIACYEADVDLTYANVKRFCRFHPRCGTSFLILALVFSIIIFSFVTWDSIWVRVIMKIVLLPLVVGFTYELIRLAGRYYNIFTRIISAPGLWLQRLTTREPDQRQIEVAIAALSKVLPENKEEDRW